MEISKVSRKKISNTLSARKNIRWIEGPNSDGFEKNDPSLIWKGQILKLVFYNFPIRLVETLLNLHNAVWIVQIYLNFRPREST